MYAIVRRFGCFYVLHYDVITMLAWVQYVQLVSADLQRKISMLRRTVETELQNLDVSRGPL